MRGKDSLTFVLHPRELVALRSKATEILYGAANREKRPVLCWSGWRHFEGPATASIQNNSGLSQGLAGISAAGGSAGKPSTPISRRTAASEPLAQLSRVSWIDVDCRRPERPLALCRGAWAWHGW